MPQCVSETCDKPMAQGEDFCGLCGTDNRPPASRTAVPNCHHHYLDLKSLYCARCGTPRLPYLVKPWIKTGGGAAFCIILALLASAFVVCWIAQNPTGPLAGTSFADWAQAPYTTESRRMVTITGLAGSSRASQVMLWTGIFFVLGAIVAYRSKRSYEHGGQWEGYQWSSAMETVLTALKAPWKSW